MTGLPALQQHSPALPGFQLANRALPASTKPPMRPQSGGPHAQQQRSGHGQALQGACSVAVAKALNGEVLAGTDAEVRLHAYILWLLFCIALCLPDMIHCDLKLHS